MGKDALLLAQAPAITEELVGESQEGSAILRPGPEPPGSRVVRSPCQLSPGPRTGDGGWGRRKHTDCARGRGCRAVGSRGVQGLGWARKQLRKEQPPLPRGLPHPGAVAVSMFMLRRKPSDPTWGPVTAPGHPPRDSSQHS